MVGQGGEQDFMDVVGDGSQGEGSGERRGESDEEGWGMERVVHFGKMKGEGREGRNLGKNE